MRALATKPALTGAGLSIFGASTGFGGSTGLVSSEATGTFAGTGGGSVLVQPKLLASTTGARGASKHSRMRARVLTRLETHHGCVSVSMRRSRVAGGIVFVGSSCVKSSAARGLREGSALLRWRHAFQRALAGGGRATGLATTRAAELARRECGGARVRGSLAE